MRRKRISNILSVLLVVFLFGVIIMKNKLIPDLALEMVTDDPSLLPYKATMLMYTKVLLTFLGTGVLMILALIHLFKKDQTYTKKFIYLLDALNLMTLIANFILIAFLRYMGTFGAPGPIGVFIILLIIFIFIVALVIVLVRTVVKEAIVYKEENELVV